MELHRSCYLAGVGGKVFVFQLCSIVGEGSCCLRFLAYRGNLVEVECVVDKHKVTMLAGHFSALYGVSPGAGTCLIFHTYQLHQAGVGGDGLSQNKHMELLKCLAAKIALATVCSRGRKDGGRQPLGFE